MCIRDRTDDYNCIVTSYRHNINSSSDTHNLPSLLTTSAWLGRGPQKTTFRDNWSRFITRRMPFHHPTVLKCQSKDPMSDKATLFAATRILLQLPFYGHYTGQPALASTPVKNWRILLELSFTARMPCWWQLVHLDHGWCCQWCYMDHLRTATRTD